MRSRITITISEDLLEQVDQTIDNRTIRNRSQAIESLLRQVVLPKVTTAVILAGGSLTTHPQTGEQVPKTLVPIQDRPVLEHTLLLLKKYNFTDVIICTNSESLVPIKQAIRKIDLGRMKVFFSEEQEKLGTGGALKHAAKMIPEKSFILLHGDVLTNINLFELINFYVASQTKAVIATKPRPGRLSYGRVFLEGQQVIDFQVPDKAAAISLVNTGIYVFDYSVLDLLPDKKSFKIEDTLIPTLVKQHQVSGSVFQGIWFDVSDAESYEEANNRWTSD